ncbi:hypothetical protein BJ508DRAFT_331557 [Ascobolus immersus RN42]|uniref:2OGFeDO JBP1/TET oxygenase domain-containing protein n=1 Tax=Ascobolus immersus RN42 TaxID=1160509 RepID=A0A3N4HVG2_ASCIM|nr:hypothetical protein BJ508DRAFT_331557 [Ascobolus immersus RN42]
MYPPSLATISASRVTRSASRLAHSTYDANLPQRDSGHPTLKRTATSPPLPEHHERPIKLARPSNAEEVVRFELNLELEKAMEDHEQTLSHTNDVITDEFGLDDFAIPGPNDHLFPDPPLNPRAFPLWLESRTRSQLQSFIANHRALLEQAADPSSSFRLHQHARSLCDFGDTVPSVPLPTRPASVHQHGFRTSKRPPGPKERRNRNRPDRRQPNHYEQKRQEKAARISKVLSSQAFSDIRDHLSSLDMSDLISAKGGGQPKAPESEDMIEEAKGYHRVPEDVSDAGFCVTDASSDRRVLIDVLPADTIPPALLAQFESSFKSLCKDLPDKHFKISKTDKRFVKRARSDEHGGVLHLGVWNQSTWQHERPALSGSLRGDETDSYKTDPKHVRLQIFLNDNWELFSRLGGILKANHPDVFEEYDKIQLPHGIDKTAFWPFCMMALNRNYLSLPHKDLQDFVRGFCLLHCWGDFVGGELTIKELKLKIPIRPGQIILFRSALLTHWNQPIQEGGIRHSMVLFTPWRMLDWQAISDRQVLNRLHREVKAATAKLDAST